MLDINQNCKYEVSELICLKCLHRWIGVYPQETLLKELECKCGEVGFVIKTGQTIQEEKQCYKCSHYDQDKCKLRLFENGEYECGFFEGRE